jgi:hypothetical protein
MNKKKKPIIALYIFNGFIFFSGILFIIYSLYFNITFKALNTKFPAVIFGLSVLYFGFRNINSLKLLNEKVNASNSSFSWGNFAKSTKNK